MATGLRGAEAEFERRVVAALAQPHGTGSLTLNQLATLLQCETSSLAPRVRQSRLLLLHCTRGGGGQHLQTVTLRDGITLRHGPGEATEAFTRSVSEWAEASLEEPRVWEPDHPSSSLQGEVSSLQGQGGPPAGASAACMDSLLLTERLDTPFERLDSLLADELALQRQAREIRAGVPLIPSLPPSAIGVASPAASKADDWKEHKEWRRAGADSARQDAAERMRLVALRARGVQETAYGMRLNAGAVMWAPYDQVQPPATEWDERQRLRTPGRPAGGLPARRLAEAHTFHPCPHPAEMKFLTRRSARSLP